MAGPRSTEAFLDTPNGFDSRWPYNAEALLVTPDSLEWLDLQQSQLLRPPSYNFLWHAWTRVFYLRTIIACYLLDNLCGCWPVWTITMWSIYTLEIFSALVSLCKSSTCRGMRFYHPRASLSDVEWAVGWMQPDLLSYKVVSLVIDISQAILARWQGLIFIFIGNGQGLLIRWQGFTFMFIGNRQGVLTR